MSVEKLVTGLKEDADPDDAIPFLDFFAIYVLSPSVAFEQVTEDLTPQFGSHTFATIYLFLNRFGGDYELNSKLQELIPKIGLDHIVLETDAPYLAPTPHRGTPNESSYIPLIAQKIAEIMEVPVKEVMERTTENAERIFFNG